jgi:hypothetical protein
MLQEYQTPSKWSSDELHKKPYQALVLKPYFFLGRIFTALVTRNCFECVNNAKDLCRKIAQKWPEFEEFLFFSNHPT